MAPRREIGLAPATEFFYGISSPALDWKSTLKYFAKALDSSITVIDALAKFEVVLMIIHFLYIVLDYVSGRDGL